MIDTSPFQMWSILELMGHRRLGGLVQQVEMFGTTMCRIDVFTDADEPVATQFYGGASIYCLTPTTEKMARAVASQNQPEPVHRWELPALEERVSDHPMSPDYLPSDDEDEDDE